MVSFTVLPCPPWPPHRHSVNLFTLLCFYVSQYFTPLLPPHLLSLCTVGLRQINAKTAVKSCPCTTVRNPPAPPPTREAGLLIEVCPVTKKSFGSFFFFFLPTCFISLISRSLRGGGGSSAQTLELVEAEETEKRGRLESSNSPVLMPHSCANVLFYRRNAGVMRRTALDTNKARA